MSEETPNKEQLSEIITIFDFDPQIHDASFIRQNIQENCSCIIDTTTNKIYFTKNSKYGGLNFTTANGAKISTISTHLGEGLNIPSKIETVLSYFPKRAWIFFPDSEFLEENDQEIIDTPSEEYKKPQNTAAIESDMGNYYAGRARSIRIKSTTNPRNQIVFFTHKTPDKLVQQTLDEISKSTPEYEKDLDANAEQIFKESGLNETEQSQFMRDIKRAFELIEKYLVGDHFIKKDMWDQEAKRIAERIFVGSDNSSHFENQTARGYYSYEKKSDPRNREYFKIAIRANLGKDLEGDETYNYARMHTIIHEILHHFKYEYVAENDHIMEGIQEVLTVFLIKCSKEGKRVRQVDINDSPVGLFEGFDLGEKTIDALQNRTGYKLNAHATLELTKKLNNGIATVASLYFRNYGSEGISEFEREINLRLQAESTKPNEFPLGIYQLINNLITEFEGKALGNLNYFTLVDEYKQKVTELIESFTKRDLGGQTFG